MFPTVTNNFDNLHQKKCWVLILIRLKSVYPSTTAASPADPGASFTRPAQTMARKQAHAVAAAGSREAAPHIAAPALAVNPPPPLTPTKNQCSPPIPWQACSLSSRRPCPLTAGTPALPQPQQPGQDVLPPTPPLPCCCCRRRRRPRSPGSASYGGPPSRDSSGGTWSTSS